MTYTQALSFIRTQNKRIYSLNGERFECGGYEYRLKCECGFTILIEIDRRLIGKRNFKYFDDVDATDCLTAQEALERVYECVKGSGSA